MTLPYHATLGEWVDLTYGSEVAAVQLCWDDPPYRSSLFVVRVCLPLDGWHYILHDHKFGETEVLTASQLLKRYSRFMEIAEPVGVDQW